MKKDKKLKIAAVLAAVAVAGSITVYAAYDSSSDPLVSLSYLEQVFAPEVQKNIESYVNTTVSDAKTELSDKADRRVSAAEERVTALEGRVSELENTFDETVTALQSQIDALTNCYEVLELDSGTRIVADSSCEIILVSGSANVRCTDPNGGLIDCTDGTLLYDGQSVPIYHKLISPENGDGRGIVVTGTAQVLVRGGYTLA